MRWGAPGRQAKADAVGGGRRAARVLKLYIDLLSIKYLQNSVAERAPPPQFVSVCFYNRLQALPKPCARLVPRFWPYSSLINPEVASSTVSPTIWKM